jgi:hypothetical protein
LNKVLQNHLTASGIDKYDSTLFGNAADVILDAATLIANLRLIMQMIFYAPALTRDDASAGSPFTRASLTGLILNMEATSELCIPGLSLAIVEPLTKVIQCEGAAPNTGRVATYFSLLSPDKTLANIETLIGTLVSNYPGIIHFNRNKIPYAPFNRAMLQWEECSIISDYAMALSMFHTTADDGGVDVAEVDETRTIRWFRHFGIGEVYDAAALFRAQNTADSPKFLGTVANAAAGKLTIEGTATHDATSFTALADTSLTFDWIKSVADGQSRSSSFLPSYNKFGLPIGYVAAGKVTVDGWNQRLIQYLSRHINGAPLSAKGMPLLPDTVNLWRGGGAGGEVPPRNSNPPPPSGGGGGGGSRPPAGTTQGREYAPITPEGALGGGMLYDPANGQWYYR